MSKTKTQASQFPNIYRLITENNILKIIENALIRSPKQSNPKKAVKIFLSFLFFIFFVVLISGSVILALGIYQKYTEFNTIYTQREKINNEISFWQSVLQKYPGYKDAYFRIALLEYQLKDFGISKENNEKSLQLDPNFADAKKLEEILIRQ